MRKCNLSHRDWPALEKLIMRQEFEDYLRRVLALEIVKQEIMTE